MKPFLFSRVGAGLVLLISSTLLVSAWGDDKPGQGLKRIRRSPFKKHKIIVNEQYGEGWVAPTLPPPPPPVIDHHYYDDQRVVVDHQHHHHHHIDYNPPAPPPPPQIEYTVYKEDKLEGMKAEMKEKWEEMERKKQEKWEDLERKKQQKLEEIKEETEAKLDFLAQIPQKIASDIDFLGTKIKEDIDKKKAKDEGIRIQIWKNKGGNVGGGRGRVDSTETVHHHHYYNQRGESQEGDYNVPPPPPPTQRPTPQRYYQDGGYRFGDGFLTLLDQASTQFRAPVEEEGAGEGGYGGTKGKGFSLNIWKNKGRRK